MFKHQPQTNMQEKQQFEGFLYVNPLFLHI